MFFRHLEELKNTITLYEEKQMVFSMFPKMAVTDATTITINRDEGDPEAFDKPPRFRRIAKRNTEDKSAYTFL